jgi:hypothetical protein
MLLGVLACGSASTQAPRATPQEPRTQLETFATQTGTAVVKGYSEIGSVRGMGTVSVDCMELTNVSTGTRQMGITIDVKESGRLERSDRSFVDYDEIEPLLTGIDYISKVTSSSTQLSNFEAIYKTRGSLSVVTFSGSSGKIEATVSTGYIGAARAFISTDQLAELRTVIAKAKKTLDEIK